MKPDHENIAKNALSAIQFAALIKDDQSLREYLNGWLGGFIEDNPEYQMPINIKQDTIVLKEKQADE